MLGPRHMKDVHHHIIMAHLLMAQLVGLRRYQLGICICMEMSIYPLDMDFKVR